MIPWCRLSFSCLAVLLFLSVLVSVCRVWWFRLFLLCCSVACFGSFWPFLDGFCCDVPAPFPPGLELFCYFLLFYLFFFLPLVPSVILVTDLSATFLAFGVLFGLFLFVGGIGHQTLSWMVHWHGWTSCPKLDSDFSCSFHHETKDGSIQWI